MLRLQATFPVVDSETLKIGLGFVSLVVKMVKIVYDSDEVGAMYHR